VSVRVVDIGRIVAIDNHCLKFRSSPNLIFGITSILKWRFCSHPKFQLFIGNNIT